MIPYKIYINWDGVYTGGVLSSTFVEITDEVYDLNLTLTRRRDNMSIAIVRNFLEGDFTIKDSNYDLLKTAIDSGIPELIIKIEKYSTALLDYTEVWRGAAETRPALMDDNRNIAKLTKFKTIDDYSDIDTSYSKSFTEVFADYFASGKGTLVEFGYAQRFISPKKLYSTENTDSFETVDWENNIDIKYTNVAQYRITPGYYDSGFVFFFGSINSRERGLMVDSVNNWQNNKNFNVSFSLRKILEMYKSMFNLFWFVADALYFPDMVKSIQFKTPDELFNTNIVDYTTESSDFAGFSYLDIEYFIRESFSMSSTNEDIDHITQHFEYQLLADNNFYYQNDDIVTDLATYLFTAEIKNNDLAAYTSDVSVAGDTSTVKSALSINGTSRQITNYISSLSYRMANFLNDYRQLDSAKFNGSVQSLNPNLARPSIEQEPFNIEIDLLTDLDFFCIIQTSIGDTYASELIWDIKTNSTKLICQK